MPEIIARYLPDSFGLYLSALPVAWLMVALVVLFMIWTMKELAFERLKVRNDFVRMGEAIGFKFYPSGLAQFDVCDLRAMRGGMEVSLCIKQGIVENDPAFFIEVTCFARNPSRVLLSAYPSSSLDIALPTGARSPVIENVPYWDWYTVRGSSPDKIREALADVRKDHDTVFQDNWGFVRLELDEKSFRCLFHFRAAPNTAQLKKITDEAVAIAAKFDR